VHHVGFIYKNKLNLRHYNKTERSEYTTTSPFI